MSRKPNVEPMRKLFENQTSLVDEVRRLLSCTVPMSAHEIWRLATIEWERDGRYVEVPKKLPFGSRKIIKKFQGPSIDDVNAALDQLIGEGKVNRCVRELDQPEVEGGHLITEKIEYLRLVDCVITLAQIKREMDQDGS